MTNSLYEPSTERSSCGIGFVANLRGEKSRGIVEQAFEVLARLKHRAATGKDPLTGDGAGILLQLPHRFFKSSSASALTRPWSTGTFGGTPSRLSGEGMAELDLEVRARHGRGFSPGAVDQGFALPFTGGVYQWRRRREQHLWNPGTLARLQAAARANDSKAFEDYERLADHEGRTPALLRGLLDAVPVHLSEVEEPDKALRDEAARARTRRLRRLVRRSAHSVIGELWRDVE